jgi:hypothetical protein
MTVDEIDEMMQLADEHDVGFQRERLRDRLDEIGWSAREGELTDGDRFSITEWSGFSPDPMNDRDFEWQVEYDGEIGMLRLHSPDGRVHTSIDPHEDLLNAMGEVSKEWHLERVIEKYKREVDPDPGIRCLSQGKLEILENGLVEVYDPGYELYATVELRELTADLVRESIAERRRQIEPELEQAQAQAQAQAQDRDLEDSL